MPSLPKNSESKPSADAKSKYVELPNGEVSPRWMAVKPKTTRFSKNSISAKYDHLPEGAIGPPVTVFEDCIEEEEILQALKRHNQSEKA